jgi:hypothetical protein
MKKYLIINKMLLALAALVIIASSCTKVKSVTPTTTEGKTYVKILKGGDANPAPVVKNPIDFVPVPAQLLVVDLRREIPTADELNKTVNVTIKDDTAAVRAANPAYLQMPIAWYTIQGDGVKTGGQGGTYTFTFKPGEFAKQIYITIPNATVLNPSALYGLGFTITSADGGVTVREKSIVVEIGAKNPWDGIYAVTGPMADAVNPLLVQWNNSLAAISDPFCTAHGGAWELHLITTGATQCIMYDNTIWGDFFHPIWATPGNSGYGSFALLVNFNPANNTISSVTNYYGQPAGNTRSAVLDPSGANAVQGNKDILIKYFMIQTNQATGTGPRTTFNEKWEYTGPR